MPDAIKVPLEMFYHWEATTPEQVFLRQPSNLQWREYTWAEVADRVRRLASFVRARDFPEGSKIAIFSGNSADWFVVDLAIMLSGLVSVLPVPHATLQNPLPPAVPIAFVQHVNLVLAEVLARVEFAVATAVAVLSSWLFRCKCGESRQLVNSGYFDLVGHLDQTCQPVRVLG